MKDRKALTYELEEEIYKEGYSLVCGTDEAGRGPLAGAVYAAAVVLPRGLTIEGLDDSKKLSPKKRDELFDIIKEKAICFAVCSEDQSTIDEINILNATLKAMARAIESLSPSPDFALIDGNCSRGIKIASKTVVGGDGKSPSIAAASILAKVSRDRACIELDRLYPQYGFAKHKGYGTREHIEALKKFGACPAHRKTFLKFLGK